MEQICNLFDTTSLNVFKFINFLEPIEQEISNSNTYDFIDNILNSDRISQESKESFYSKFGRRYINNSHFRELVNGCYFVFTFKEYLGACDLIDEDIVNNPQCIIFNMYQENNSIFKYPDDIILNILLENLSLKDIINLDKSTTNRDSRKRLLDIFKNRSFIIKYPVKYNQWFHLRNIKCEDITILPNKNYTNISQYDRSFVEYCINNGSTIKKLDVSKISMFNEDSLKIIENCKNLRHFTFRNLSYRQGIISSPINLRFIYNNLQKLEHLEFDPDLIFYDNEVLLPETYSNVRSLFLNLESHNEFRYNIAVKILEQCKNLKLLSTKHLRYMSPDFFVYLADNFKELEELDISLTSFWQLNIGNEFEKSRTENFANVCLKYLIDNLPKLRKLNINYCPWITYDTIKYIYSNFVNNERFYIEQTYNIGTPELTIDLIKCVYNPLKIKILDISCYYYDNDFPIEFLSSTFKNLKTIVSLPTMKDNDIAILTKNCKMITSLSLAGNPYLSNNSIFSIVNNLKFIEEISIHSKKVTDQAMIEMFKTCKYLKKLEITGCFNLTDLSFQYIICLKNLKIMSINDKISNNCLKNIVMNCYNLEDISIYENGSYITKKYIEPFDDNTDIITYDLVIWIVKNAHNLKSFRIQKQNTLTNDQRRELLNLCGRSYFPDFLIYLINNRDY